MSTLPSLPFYSDFFFCLQKRVIHFYLAVTYVWPLIALHQWSCHGLPSHVPFSVFPVWWPDHVPWMLCVLEPNLMWGWARRFNDPRMRHGRLQKAQNAKLCYETDRWLLIWVLFSMQQKVFGLDVDKNYRHFVLINQVSFSRLFFAVWKSDTTQAFLPNTTSSMHIQPNITALTNHHSTCNSVESSLNIPRSLEPRNLHRKLLSDPSAWRN